MTNTPTLFGISNCDTVRKARRWLDQAGVDYRFHDFRKDGLSLTDIDRWLERVSLETLVNRRGTSWRQLDESSRDSLLKGDTSLILSQPTLIKRPVMEVGSTVMVGFDDARYRSALATED